jgi:hypothetical protein
MSERGIPKATYWIMRYASNRGTDQRICVALAAGTKRSAALEVAKDWAERATAGTACHEYTVTVRRVKIPPRTELLKRWERLCKSKRIIEDRWSDARQMFVPLNWTTL